MSIAEQQPSTTATTDPDLAKFSAGSVVRVLGDSEHREFTVITRYFTWSIISGRREYFYRLGRDLGNGMTEIAGMNESEIEGVETP